MDSKLKKYLELTREREKLENYVHGKVKPISKRYYEIDKEEYKVCRDIYTWRVEEDEIILVSCDYYGDKDYYYFDYETFFDESVISKLEKEYEEKLAKEERDKKLKAKAKKQKREKDKKDREDFERWKKENGRD